VGKACGSPAPFKPEHGDYHVATRKDNTMAKRSDGEDMEVRLRIRRANFNALLGGVVLGIDAAARKPILIRLEPVGDDVYSLQAETNSIVPMSIPDPVDVEHIEDIRP
jgi:hypothetical protein